MSERDAARVDEAARHGSCAGQAWTHRPETAWAAGRAAPSGGAWGADALMHETEPMQGGGACWTLGRSALKPGARAR